VPLRTAVEGGCQCGTAVLCVDTNASVSATITQLSGIVPDRTQLMVDLVFFAIVVTLTRAPKPALLVDGLHRRPSNVDSGAFVPTGLLLCFLRTRQSKGVSLHDWANV
jgi:hypothetical protein